uniref:Cytochrome P450 20A1 n=1 Tax=Magallana gigas TaxID=29159 RepID=K1QQY1_MAGGI
MLYSVVLVAVFLCGLYLAVTFLFPRRKRSTTIPGPNPATKEGGNLEDIRKAGSLHEYLIDLHKQYGDITAFWMGQEFVVSICSPELFKQHSAVFDRPVSLFKLFEPLIGAKSIQYANKEDGKNRRKQYNTVFNQNYLHHYYARIQEESDDLVKQFTSLPKEEHVPVARYMVAFALKLGLVNLFDSHAFTDEEILEIRHNYDIAWSELERQLVDIPEKGSPRIKAFEDAKRKLYALVDKVLSNRKQLRKDTDDALLIDVLLDSTDDKELIANDALSFVIGGFHTTGNMLTWAVYFLAEHQDVQDKVYREISQVLGNNDVEPETSKDLVFDPDRFSPENSKSRPSYAFQPFGFAGKRICPGYKFAYVEAIIGLVTILRKFNVKMVEGQTVTQTFGLVTHPTEEIWITLQER